MTNAVLLRPLPYKNPDRLVLAWKDYTKPHIRNLPFNTAESFDLRDGTNSVFEDVGAVFTFRVIVPREDGTPERIYKAQVTTNFFQMMGAKMEIGVRMALGAEPVSIFNLVVFIAEDRTLPTGGSG